jgi:hypothetical protein
MMFAVLMRESLTTQPSAKVAEVLYRRAGMGPADVDVAQLYDCFTITVLVQLEDKYRHPCPGALGAGAAVRSV